MSACNVNSKRSPTLDFHLSWAFSNSYLIFWVILSEMWLFWLSHQLRLCQQAAAPANTQHYLQITDNGDSPGKVGPSENPQMTYKHLACRSQRLTYRLLIAHYSFQMFPECFISRLSPDCTIFSLMLLESLMYYHKQHIECYHGLHLMGIGGSSSALYSGIMGG